MVIDAKYNIAMRCKVSTTARLECATACETMGVKHRNKLLALCLIIGPEYLSKRSILDREHPGIFYELPYKRMTMSLGAPRGCGTSSAKPSIVTIPHPFRISLRLLFHYLCVYIWIHGVEYADCVACMRYMYIFVTNLEWSSEF